MMRSRAHPARPKEGQVIVLFAAVLVMVVIMAALAVDVGRIVTSQAELQNAVDAAALAGASQLIGFVDESAKASARSLAISFAEKNLVAGDGLTLAADDIQFGRYDDVNRRFVPETQMAPGQIIDSMQVTGRRTNDSPDGPIGLFFASLFGMRVQASRVRAVGTQPRRYVMFVMDRSGSMCYDTTGIVLKSAPQSNASMVKSPTGWYWMPKQIYQGGAWRTAYFYAQDDVTGQVRTDFLPAHIRANLYLGQYFRYCERDRQSTVQSGWLKAPSSVTIYSYYGSSYLNWRADAYGPVGSCAYAYATGPIEPIASSQNAAVAFVDLLNVERERAGLVSYAWDAVLEYPLTNDFEALKATMRAYDPRGATATPAGMEKANDEFLLSGRASGYGQRIMILLTDGMANTVSGTYYDNPTSTVTFCGQTVTCKIHQTVATALQAQTLRARNNGIRIYTVSFGQDSDQVLMPIIAQQTGGSYYYAPNHANLTEIFVDIFHKLPPILTR